MRVWCFALCASLFIGEAAWAGTSLQGTLTASAGVTDNVTNAPNEPAPNERGRQTDLIITLSPGLTLTTGSPRAVQALSYVFGGVLYARNSDADTYTNTVNWNGFFLPGKTTAMSLSLGLSQGRQSAFNTAVASTDTQVQVQPIGVTNLLSINANQNFVWEMTAKWRLIQSLGFGTTYFIDQSPPIPQAQTVPAHVGIERQFARDALGIDVGANYTNFPEQRGPVLVPAGQGREEADGVVTPAQQQVTVTPLARWRRDLTYFMASRVEAGAVVVFDPTEPSRHLVEPAGGLGLNFFSRLVTFDISYAHSVQPNLLFHSNFLSDLGLLRGNFLLGERSGFSLALGLGYGYNRQIDLDPVATTMATAMAGAAAPTSSNAHAHTILADATINYAPIKALAFFLRYQLVDQIGSNEPGTLVPLPSYYRNTLIFGIAAIYPPEAAAEVPKGAAGARADRRDDPTISSSKSTAR